MDDGVRTLLFAALVALQAAGLPAQDPAPTPQPPQQQPPPQPQQPPQQQPPPSTQQPPKPEPIDPAKAAADLLRKRLGLQPGPAGEPPAGPPAKPAEAVPEDPDRPARTEEPAAAGAAQPAAPQDPQPQQPPPQDPAEAARRALQRLMPEAKPPEAAPIPNAQGTPDTTLPPGPDAAAKAPLPEKVGTEWHGVLAMRYRARHGDGENDHELAARAFLDIGNGARDPFTFHLAAYGFADLDGSDPGDPFAGLDESLGELNGRIYAAHVDAHRLPGLELARLGRQDLVETPTPVTFDGLRVDSERFGSVKAFLSAYGGVPVHHFEASSSGDSIYGVGGGFSPWHAARVRLDWMSIRDEFLPLDREDDVLGARWWQDFEGVQLHGLHTWVDGKPRDLHVGARGGVDLPVVFAVDYRELLTTQRAQVTELDPYYAIAGEYRPYRQIDATLSRDLGEDVTATLGGAMRRLADGGDEGTFNREFDRLNADLFVGRVFADELSLSLGASWWDTDDEDYRAFTGELQYETAQGLRLSLGSGYDLFKYDVFSDRERIDVHTLYVRAVQRLSASVRLDAAYEFETDDDDDYHVLRVEVIWTL